MSLAVDAAVEAVAALTPAELSCFLDDLDDDPRVQALGYRVRQKRATFPRYARRNVEIYRRHEAGASYRVLALDYGITPSGIAKVVARTRKLALDAELASRARRRLG